MKKTKTIQVGLMMAACLTSPAWADTINVTPGGPLTLQQAIDSATAGDDIVVQNGVYTLTGTLNVTKSVSITGASEAGVQIDASGNGTSWGILVSADDVTLSTFTLLPPIVPGSVGTSGGGGFPIHANFDSTGPSNVPHSNLTLDNITVANSNRTAFDVHGYDGVSLTNLTASGAAYGNGIQVTGCDNVSATGCTLTANAWGGFAFYASRAVYLNRGSSNSTLNLGANSIDGIVYVEDDYGLENTNIVIQGGSHEINNDYNPGTASFQAFINGSFSDAVALGGGLNAKFSNSASSVEDLGSGDFLVGAGMSIQTAIDAAPAAGQVVVDDGTFNENLNVNKPLTLASVNGSGATTVQGSSAQSVALGGGNTGTICIGSNDVSIGSSGADGFLIRGYDVANPAVEHGAIYLKGSAQTGLAILGNDIVADGEAGLLSAYGSTKEIEIGGNTFSGKTYVGATVGGSSSVQFSVHNVPRSMIYFGGPCRDINFHDNIVGGSVGGVIGAGPTTYYNTGATIDCAGATSHAEGAVIINNTFTVPSWAALRARGEFSTIQDNTFDSSAAGPLAVGTFYANTANDVYSGNEYVTGAGANGFLGDGSSNVVFPEALADYSLAWVPPGILVSGSDRDVSLAAHGTLEFSDQTIPFDVFGGTEIGEGETLEFPGELTIGDGVTPVTISVNGGTLKVGSLNLQPGAILQVIGGELELGDGSIISGTFTIFNSLGSWDINGNTTFNVGQSLALITDIHIASGATVTVTGGGELILDGCLIDSQTGGSSYNIVADADGVLTMARCVVSDAVIDVNTSSGSVAANLVSRIYDSSFTDSDLEASADARVYHNIFGSGVTANNDSTSAFDDVDGWGNVASSNDLENLFTLNFDAPASADRTLDADGNLFVQTGDEVLLSLDISDLGTHGISTAEALLGYNSGMLALDTTPVVPTTGVGGIPDWATIVESTPAPAAGLGLVDSTLGLELTAGQAGITSDMTAAKVDFVAGSAGATYGFFRVQTDNVFDGTGALLRDTRLTELDGGGAPSYLTAFTANSGQLVIDNEAPEIDALSATGTQTQPSEPVAVDVFDPANRVFRHGDPVIITFDATDNGHGLAGLDAPDAANDLVLTELSGPTSLTEGVDYTVSAADVAGVVTYTVTLDIPATTAPGTYTVSGTVQDRSGNVSAPTTLGSYIIANEALVEVELQGFTATTREVTFVATGGVSETWTKTITNFAGGIGSVILEDIPAGTTNISAKTDWNLRSKVAASFTPAGVGSASLTGGDLLPGGDINGDNVINTFDYSILRFNWLTNNAVSDITGDGATSGPDYNLLRTNFYTVGDAE